MSNGSIDIRYQKLRNKYYYKLAIIDKKNTMMLGCNAMSIPESKTNMLSMRKITGTIQVHTIQVQFHESGSGSGALPAPDSDPV